MQDYEALDLGGISCFNEFSTLPPLEKLCPEAYSCIVEYLNLSSMDLRTQCYIVIRKNILSQK